VSVYMDVRLSDVNRVFDHMVLQMMYVCVCVCVYIYVRVYLRACVCVCV